MTDAPRKLCFISAKLNNTYFEHVFASTSEAVEVIVDRRLGDRRQRHAPVGLERRRQERRVREGVAKDLDTFGWAVVRH